MPSPKNIIKKCIICEKKFFTSIAEINKGKGKICSNQCAIILLANINKKSVQGWLYHRQARRGLKEYRAKENARHKVYRAVKSGKILKPSRCQDCGQTTTVKASISDFNNPLVNLNWYCNKCHPKKRSLIELVFN